VDRLRALRRRRALDSARLAHPTREPPTDSRLYTATLRVEDGFSDRQERHG
jgi:hypothetical protein